MRKPCASLAAACLLAAFPATALAQISPGLKCMSLKLKTAGKYGACRLVETAKAEKLGIAADFEKCDGKLSTKWQAAETKGDGQCPTTMDLTSIQGVVEQHSDNVTQLLSGVGTEDPDAVYVKATGGADASGCGTIASPCASIGFAISEAESGGKLRVYAASQQYDEDIDLSDGIDVLGGYDPSSWLATENPSVLYGTSGSGHRAAVTATGIASATSFEGFVVHAASATTPGANSYAIYVSASSNQLSIRDVVVYAGAGAPGQPASDGSDGNDGGDGTGRDSNPALYDAFIASGASACNALNMRQFSNGATRICGASVASGGNGGGVQCPVSSVFDEDGATDGFSSGAGTSGGDAGNDSVLTSSGSVCQVPPSAAAAGADGSDGSDGVSASSGSGCSNAGGNVVAGHWVPSSGGSGGSGTAGTGGGGGGGGGGAFCSSCAEGKDRLGGHGGGGGAGACGGTGGGGGTGAGASFAIFVAGGTAPQITGTTITLGNGGAGGSGGNGGSGGEAGSGGAGGNSALFCASGGGRGGDGGNGGHGGGGGGGCGGSSYGIYTSGVGTPPYCALPSGNSFSGGVAGGGGSGGTSLGNGGADGAGGQLADCSFH